MLRQLFGPQVSCGFVSIVFRALHCLGECFRAPGNDGLHPFWRRAERRRDLRRVGDGDTAAGSRGDINHVAAGPNGMHRSIDKLCDIGNGRRNSGGHQSVFSIDDFQNSFSRE